MKFFALSSSRFLSVSILCVALYLTSGDRFMVSGRMVALIANLVRIYDTILGNNTKMEIFHNPKIPPPPILHKVLDDEFLSAWSDVLIVGDLHGCYDEFVEILDLANKAAGNNSKILKLFVGDIVNKGPKSKQIIEYFINNGKEDMLAVRGNHEERIIQNYISHMQDKNAKLKSEYNWIKNLNSEHIDFLISFPYTISLPKFNAIIVHAGLLPGKPLEQQIWSDMTQMRNIVHEDYFDGKGLRGTTSELEGDPWINMWRGDSHIFFGHDAKRELQLTEYATGLDTGVVYGKKLTAILMNQKSQKKQFLEVKAKRQYTEIIDRTKS